MAKIYIAYGSDGKIIAASGSKNLARPVYDDGGKVMTVTKPQKPPEKTRGVTEGEFEVPAKFANKKIHEYIPLLVVDVATRQLKEKGEEHKGKNGSPR